MTSNDANKKSGLLPKTFSIMEEGQQKIEKYKMKTERYKMKTERYKMKTERYKMKTERYKMKAEMKIKRIPNVSRVVKTITMVWGALEALLPLHYVVSKSYA